MISFAILQIGERMHAEFFLPGSLLQALEASFVAPDAVCTGRLVNITNTSSVGSTSCRNFYPGNATADPIATNIGTPGKKLSRPVLFWSGAGSGRENQRKDLFRWRLQVNCHLHNG